MRPAAGGAPGLYAQYTWPTPSGTSKDMRVGHTVSVLPLLTLSQAPEHPSEL